MASTAVMASDMDTMRLKTRRIRLGPTALLIILAGGALFRGRRRTNPDQASFFPYLTGYVLFHCGDYKTEITELGKASQEDPFVLTRRTRRSITAR
jgi:hypothetical protein